MLDHGEHALGNFVGVLHSCDVDATAEIRGVQLSVTQASSLGLVEGEEVFERDYMHAFEPHAATTALVTVWGPRRTCG